MQGERAEDIVGETGLCRAWPALFQAVSDGESSRARCHIISNQIPVSSDALSLIRRDLPPRTAQWAQR